MNRVTRYDYDANGRLIKTTRPNGTQQLRHYDAKGQLLQQRDVFNQTVITQFDYRYDAVGNIIEETKQPANPVPNLQLEMSYAPANQLATVNQQSVELDADGNMINGILNGQLTQFNFDSRNRLIQVGDTIYRYDAENHRIAVNQTQFVVNPQPALSQVLVRTKGNGEVTYYVYGLGLIGEESAGNYFSYHFDYRGSTVALTNAIGQVVDRVAYSAYGELLIQPTHDTPFLFNGMYGVMTDDNGLYYMRARFYSPEIKRFVNQDVLLGLVSYGQTLNRFVYSIGNPINHIDPQGRWANIVIGVIVWISTELILPELSSTEVPFDSGEVTPSALPEIVPITAIGSSKLWKQLFCKSLIPLQPTIIDNVADDVLNEADDLIDIYRGVRQYHPGLLDALDGIVKPRGGHSDIALHNYGDTASEFTSWTRNKITAEVYAQENGPGGVLLHKRVDPSDLIQSPDKYKESEVLLKGIVTGAKVIIMDE